MEIYIYIFIFVYVNFVFFIDLIMTDESMGLVTTILENIDQDPVLIMILIIGITILSIESVDRTFIIDLTMDSLVIGIMEALGTIGHLMIGKLVRNGENYVDHLNLLSAQIL